MKVIKYILVLGALFTIAGCSTRLDATMSPEKSLNKDFGNVYVAHFSPDKRNLNYIIADKLTLLGYPAMPLDGNETPENADMIITYIDNWQWDMTNYLIKIKIDFREADNKQLIITGESFRTSLARKPPEFMIQEALEKILQEAGLPYNHIQ